MIYRILEKYVITGSTIFKSDIDGMIPLVEVKRPASKSGPCSSFVLAPLERPANKNSNRKARAIDYHRNSVDESDVPPSYLRQNAQAVFQNNKRRRAFIWLSDTRAEFDNFATWHLIN